MHTELLKDIIGSRFIDLLIDAVKLHEQNSVSSFQLIATMCNFLPS